MARIDYRARDVLSWLTHRENALQLVHERSRRVLLSCFNYGMKWTRHCQDILRGLLGATHPTHPAMGVAGGGWRAAVGKVEGSRQ